MTSVLPTRLSIGLLALAVAAGGAAWRLQAEAATALERAVAVQERRIPEPEDAAPTSLEEYRNVIRALQESIALRGRIDRLLTRVEDVLATLGEHQTQAAAVAEGARGELEEIARILGGAGEATDLSVTRLGELDGRLGDTARLARQIAEELEELDRSLGPSAGVGP